MQRVVHVYSTWALVVAATASALQLAPSNNGIQSISCRRQVTNAPRRLNPYRPSTMRISQVLFLADEGEEQEDMTVDFFVSPVQIAFLRKEANKRESNKRLPKFNLPPQETADVSPETLSEISNLFDKSELIEVRGMSKDSKRKVFDTAHGLAGTLEDAFEKPVVVVDIKGYAVKLYCPWDNDDEHGVKRGGRIQLRSNYRPGQWTRKAKSIRDNRGQIITDEDGLSIKEIPEE
ncbi:hypothetical protein ACHAXA_002711 [Cyclostephanos tholiformis]|uniref:Uncharacterized protein n=1 Tax=Cyclostephanos tholiformis TaxID=382380 RepID=A0ABD3R7A5_9STRA